MSTKRKFLTVLGLSVASITTLSGCAASNPGGEVAPDPVSYQEGYKEWLKQAKEAAKNPEDSEGFSYRYTIHLGDNMYFSAQLIPDGRVIECLGASASPDCDWNPAKDTDGW